MIFEDRIVLTHAVERQTGFAQLGDLFLDVGTRAGGVKCLECGAEHDQLDRHALGPRPSEVVADVAERHVHLVEVAEVIGDFRRLRRSCLPRARWTHRQSRR